jgi:hypothetical protein
MAEVAVPRQLFAAMLARIGGCGWRVPRDEVCGDGPNGLPIVAAGPRCAVRVTFGR